MAPDGELRGSIEALLHPYVKLGLKNRVSLGLEQTEQEKLAEMAELTAMVATSVAAGNAVWPEPASGFAEASGLTFGQSTFAAEPWVPKERAHIFRKVGRTETEKELKRLAKAWKEVISALGGLHKPAIDAVQSKIAGTIAHELAEAAAKLEKIKSALADLHVPKKQGPQPRKQAEQRFTVFLARLYLDLTGTHPSPSESEELIKHGSFHALAADVFAAAGIEPPSFDMVRTACKAVTKKSL